MSTEKAATTASRLVQALEKLTPLHVAVWNNDCDVVTALLAVAKNADARTGGTGGGAAGSTDTVTSGGVEPPSEAATDTKSSDTDLAATASTTSDAGAGGGATATSDAGGATAPPPAPAPAPAAPAPTAAPTAAPGEQDVTGDDDDDDDDDDDGAATATAPTIAATTTEEVEVQIVAEEGAGAGGDAGADDDEATNSSTPGEIIDDVIVDEIAPASGHVKELLDAKDARGRTPLHLAVLLGHDKVAHLLVDAGASVKARDAEFWSSMSNALHQYDEHPELVEKMFGVAHYETKRIWDLKRPKLAATFAALRDFQVKFKFALSTWIPLVSRMLPSDECTVWKRGACCRLDCTLAGFKSLKWKRGHLSFLFFGHDSPLDAKRFPAGTLIVLNHKRKVWANVLANVEQPTRHELVENLGALLNTNTMTVDWWSRDVVIAPIVGWWNKKPVAEAVGPWTTTPYNMSNLRLTVEMRSAAKPTTYDARLEADRERRELLRKKHHRPSESNSDDVDSTGGAPGSGVETDDGDALDAELQAAMQSGALFKRAQYGAGTESSGVKSIVRGASEQWDTEVTTGTKVSWEISVKERDIGLTVTFHRGEPGDGSDAGSQPTSTTVVDERVKEHSGEFIADAAGRLVLQFDNAFAYWHTKQVHFRVIVQPRVDDAAAGGASAAAEGGDVASTPSETGATGGAGAGAGAGGDAGAGASVDAAAADDDGAVADEEDGDDGGSVSFEQYFGVPVAAAAEVLKAKYPAVGAHDSVPITATANRMPLPKPRVVKKTFSAKANMAKDFPLPLSHLLPVAEVLARTGSHFENFNRFFQTKLPPGFPVKFNIPVVPTVSAKFEFTSASFQDELPVSLFAVPDEYEDFTEEFQHGQFF